MLRSVERMGSQHALVDVRITASLTVVVCPEYELSRFEFMAPLLRAHSVSMVKRPFNDTYPRKSPGGLCYLQAFELARQFDLIYCEGVMLLFGDCESVPVAHAWCCDRRGEIIDPTCPKLQSLPQVVYLGIPFRMDYITEQYVKNGFLGVMDGHPDFGDTVGPYADPPRLWKEFFDG